MFAGASFLVALVGAGSGEIKNGREKKKTILFLVNMKFYSDLCGVVVLCFCIKEQESFCNAS